jgi:two-component SAPR family response regulator
MIIEIKRPVTKDKVNEAIVRITKESKKKSLRKHFGKLKRGLDGSAYQKKVRNEWA